MNELKKVVAVYLVGIAVAVAVYFVINPLLADVMDVAAVWLVLDILMAIGLALALIFNYANKREVDGRDPEGPISRGYLEANAAFYITAGVTILFLHNWFSLLAQGTDSLDGNHQAWVIWAAVDTVLPLVLGVTGCRLWRGTPAS